MMSGLGGSPAPLSAPDISGESKPDLAFEIGHLLLIDVVGFSKLLINEQAELLQELNRIVQASDCFQEAEKSGRLIRLPTGDGMALMFFRSPEEPVQCALEISEELTHHPHLQVRIGVHSGPVSQVTDVNGNLNIVGSGINVAQRVMDCGDAGHILLSKRIAEDVSTSRQWQPYLRDLGECEVKHGLRVHLFSLCKNGVGNPSAPLKLSSTGKTGAVTGRLLRSPRARWALGLAVLAIVGVAILFHRSSSAVLPDKSIAVLPFENRSDDKADAFFAEGVQDEILTDLARVADLKVISRTSVMQYPAGEKRNLRAIAKALGVSNIVEGSVQRSGGRVRVYAQLIDARTDTHLWADKYERAIEDVFDIQTELAEQIVAELKSKLLPSEKEAIERPSTTDLAAFEAYTRAKAILLEAVTSHPTYDNLTRAIHLLDEAVQRDKSFLLAYYQLSHAHDQMYLLGFDHTPSRIDLAERAIQSMQRFAPDAGETHLALAKHVYWAYLDYNRAREELKAAQIKLPNDPMVFLLTGYVDRRQGRWEQSTANMEHALSLDPQNLLVLEQMSLTFENLRRYADQAAVLDRAFALAPDHVSVRIQRASVDLNWRADSKPLQATIDAIAAENPESLSSIGDQWLYLALCQRDPEAARRALAIMLSDGCDRDGFPFPVAWCHGLAARLNGNSELARVAFTQARADLAKTVADEPTYAKALCALGMIDAALGRKEAMEEGERAVELLPISKDAVDGALLIQYLAIIYAWTGKKDAAIEQLAKAAKLPGYLSYGHLRLHPYWDPLRDDPRFEQIVTSLAPSN